MREATRRDYVTYDEYLRIEEESRDVRHEYVAGALYAMVGASRRHNLIIGNIYAELRRVARGGSCQVFFNDVKLRAAPDLVYYPDLVVTCDPEDDDPLIVTRPCLVVEVLSPGTASIDRTEKLIAYRNLPSLRSYLIVYQDEVRVEHFWRDERDEGRHAAFLTDGQVSLPCPQTDLSLADIYEGLPPVEA